MLLNLKLENQIDFHYNDVDEIKIRGYRKNHLKILGYSEKYSNIDSIVMDKWNLHTLSNKIIEVEKIKLCYINNSNNMKDVLLFALKNITINIKDTCPILYNYLTYKWYDLHDYRYDLGKEYAYQLAYCDKSISLSNFDSTGKITTEFSANYLPWGGKDNMIRIADMQWKEGKPTHHKISQVDGTVIEAIERNGLGIEAINRMRALINGILPFNEDVFSKLFVRFDFSECNGLELFFPDLKPLEEDISHQHK